jgi:hypothetical protein
MITLEALVAAGADPAAARQAVKDRRATRFGLDQSTVEIRDEHAAGAARLPAGCSEPI